MKRLWIIIVLSVVLGQTTWAQKHLNVAEMFDGRYKGQENAIEVTVKGEKLEPYGLDVFRSLTLKNSPGDFERMEKLVEQDGRNAVNKETGRIGERLYYGFYCFPYKKDKYCYLFYRNSSLRRVEDNEVTLIYMEGNVTLEDLKEMFK